MCVCVCLSVCVQMCFKEKQQEGEGGHFISTGRMWISFEYIAPHAVAFNRGIDTKYSAIANNLKKCSTYSNLRNNGCFTIRPGFDC